MIFIFSAESAPGVEGGGRARRGKAAGEGRRYRGGCRERASVAEVGSLLVVVAGRASKAVVQTSGTMEATLVF